MKLFAVFDTYADSYEVRDAVEELRSIGGVKSIEVLERVAGEMPQYCIAYDIEDDGAQETMERIRQAVSQYSSYIRNHTWGAYKKIG
jgi:hypothetical protein